MPSLRKLQERFAVAVLAAMNIADEMREIAEVLTAVLHGAHKGLHGTAHAVTVVHEVAHEKDATTRRF